MKSSMTSLQVNAYVRSIHFSGFGDDAIFTWIVETL
jgi:hypothetical protein